MNARQNKCPQSIIKEAIEVKVEEVKRESNTTINSRKAKIPAAIVSPKNLSRPLPLANLMSSKEAYKPIKINSISTQGIKIS